MAQINDDDRTDELNAVEDPEDEGPAPTPFDHPFFIPALVFAFGLWFGYDAFLNSDPDMAEHITFNRWGFGICVVAFGWTLRTGLREMREDKERAADEANSG